MPATNHIGIKKGNLKKKDVAEPAPKEEAFEVPKWQKEEVRRRIEKYKNNPEKLIDEGTFFAMLNED